MLLRVAGEDDLGAARAGHFEDLDGLERGELSGFVDHDDGLRSDRDAAPGDADVEFVDAPVGGVEIVAERERDAPGHRGCDDVVAGIAVEVGYGPEGGRLPAAGGALDDGDLAALCGCAHGVDLFVGDRVVLGLELVDLGVGGRGRNGEAVGAVQLGCELVNAALGFDRVRGGEGSAVGEERAGVVGGVGLVELDHFLCFEDLVEHALALFAGQEAGGGVVGFLDEVGVFEGRLELREFGRDGGEPGRDFEFLVLGDFKFDSRLWTR